MKTTHTLIALACLATLSACTSEGGAGSPGADNSQRTDGFESGFSYNPSPLEISQAEAIQFDESNAAEFARLALQKATTFAVNGIVNSNNLAPQEEFFAQGGGQQSAGCNGGGSFEVSSIDQNSNGRIDANDQFRLVFNQCNGSQGAVTTRYVSYSGSARGGAATTNHFVSADQFKGTLPGSQSSATVQGTDARRIVTGGGRYQYIVDSPSLQIMEVESGRGQANYALRLFLDVQGSLRLDGSDTLVKINYKETGDVSTRLDIPADKAYAAQGENLAVMLSDNALSRGTMEITSDGKIGVLALGNSTGRYRVRVSLDSNSDNRAEKTCDFDYAELMAGNVSFTNETCGSPAMPVDPQNPVALLPIDALPLVPLASPLLAPVLGNLLGGLTGSR